MKPVLFKRKNISHLRELLATSINDALLYRIEHKYCSNVVNCSFLISNPAIYDSKETCSLNTKLLAYIEHILHNHVDTSTKSK